MSPNVTENPIDLRLGRTRLAVSFLFFGQGFCFATWASRIPDVKYSLQLSEAALGNVLFSIPLGQLFTMPIAGRLVTRFGSRRVLAFGPLLYTLALVLMGLSSNIWALASALFLFGAFSNLCNIALNAQGVAAERLYGRSIMSSFHGAWSLAGFSAAIFALALMQFEISTQAHFVLVALMALLSIAVNHGYLLPVKDAAPTAQRLFSKPDARLLQLGIIAFCCMAAEGSMFDWSGVYFKEIVNTPASLVSLGYAAFMIAMASGRFIGDKLIDRWGRRKVLPLNGALITLGMMLAVLFPSIVPATVGFLIVGFGVSCVVPAVYSAAGRSTSTSAGMALAAVSNVGFLGFLLGPPVIGYIAAASSLRVSYALIAVFGILISYLVARPGSVFRL